MIEAANRALGVMGKVIPLHERPKQFACGERRLERRE
jgi:hypothetical protein